jgi:HEAT repeat protein
MLAFCTRCWMEMHSDAAVCPHCGAKVDDDPRAYDEKLKAALHHPLPHTRARICWLLGQRGGTAAIPNLLLMLKDEDVYVRIAALRALGKIGDRSVLPVLEEAANNSSLIIRLAATQALEAAREHSDADAPQQ